MSELKILEGTVKENREIAAGIYEMVITAEETEGFIPGRFLNVYLDDKSMLLPRPISISEASGGEMTIIYKAAGKGTESLSRYPKGRGIRTSSPLGNGYRLEGDYGGGSIALVAGGIGIPPMIGLAKALKERGARVDVFLGFQSETFLAGRFDGFCESVSAATDDGSAGFHGNAVELLKSKGRVYDEYFACGPKAMLKAISEYTSEVRRNVQVSVEERMGCGYGACVGCSCKIREDDRIVRAKVCRDGPVFLGKDVVWDE